MTISEHPELPGQYTSSHGDWLFSLEDHGDLASVDEAIEAWRDWRDFLTGTQRLF